MNFFDFWLDGKTATIKNIVKVKSTNNREKVNFVVEIEDDNEKCKTIKLSAPYKEIDKILIGKKIEYSFINSTGYSYWRFGAGPFRIID